jgi:hypothetical protein
MSKGGHRVILGFEYHDPAVVATIASVTVIKTLYGRLSILYTDAVE